MYVWIYLNPEEYAIIHTCILPLVAHYLFLEMSWKLLAEILWTLLNNSGESYDRYMCGCQIHFGSNIVPTTVLPELLQGYCRVCRPTIVVVINAFIMLMYLGVASSLRLVIQSIILYMYMYMYFMWSPTCVCTCTTHSYIWFSISHSWFPIPGDTKGIDLTLVYDHLAFAEYSLGNLRKALQYTKDLLQNGTYISFVPYSVHNQVMVYCILYICNHVLYSWKLLPWALLLTSVTVL